MMYSKTKYDGEWAISSFGKVARYVNGRAFKSSEWEKDGIPIVRIQNLNDSNAKFNYSSKIYEDRYLIQNGDLLFAWSASIGAFIWRKNNAWLNQHIFKVIPYDGINKHFLYYALQNTIPQFYNQAHGSGMVHVTKGFFEDTPILVPPLPEQRRIVAKIEELFSALDKGVETLRTLQQQPKIYRQAILENAFASIDVRYISFGEVFKHSPQNGLYKPASDYGKGTRILRIDGFYDGVIVPDYEYKRVILSQEERTKYKLKPNDLLINRVNSMPYLGKCGLVKELNEETVFESNIMKISLDTSKVNPNYVMYYLTSINGLRELRKNAKQAVNQASINQQDVANVLIKIPDCDLQNKVVEMIESKFSNCSKVEQAINESLHQAEALRQSILKKAFEGRLLSAAELEEVRKETDWEPASVLLERIKAHKAAVDTSKPPAKKSSRKGKKQA